MLKNFLTYIKKQKLFEPTDKILLAVSGGKDSVAMTDLFCSTKRCFVAIIHFNFQLRGEESNQDEEFVKNLAQKHQIPFFSTRFETKKFAKQNNLSTQMAARQLRYDWFEQIRKENNFDYIATAHHLNDSIETILLNLTKGTGIAGLKGILPKNKHVIRPLLFATREEIDNYITDNQLAWREDASNASDDYQRNMLRHQVVPILKKINPNLEETFQRNIQRFQAIESDFQKNFLSFKTTVLRKENDVFFVKIDNLKYWQSADYYLEELLKEFDFNYFQSKEIFQSLEKQSGKTFSSPTYYLIKDRKELIISEKKESDFKEILLEKNTKEIEFSENKLLINLIKKDTIIAKSDLQNKQSAYLDLSKLCFPLTFRLWKLGDSFIPLGMKGRKKISDFLIDQKISLHLKKVIFLLLSNDEVVWVVGHRIDDRFKLSDTTTDILHICIH